MTHEEAARRRLGEHVHFHGRLEHFSFTYDGRSGILTVEGAVPSFYLKQLVQNLLKNLQGVKRVRNRLQVMWPTRTAGAAMPGMTAAVG